MWYLFCWQGCPPDIGGFSECQRRSSGGCRGCRWLESVGIGEEEDVGAVGQGESGCEGMSWEEGGGGGFVEVAYVFGRSLEYTVVPAELDFPDSILLQAGVRY